MKPAVFLDRDGTINVDKDYMYRVEDFEYMEGAVEGLRALERAGFLLVVVTNQSGIARGYFTENDYHILMNWMKKDLAEKGIHIAADYFCPHLLGARVKKYEIECECRKPKTGLYTRAIRELNIDPDRSYAVGDKTRDLEICRTTGVTGVLLGDKNKEREDYFSICENWKEIVDLIKGGDHAFT